MVMLNKQITLKISEELAVFSQTISSVAKFTLNWPTHTLANPKQDKLRMTKSQIYA